MASAFRAVIHGSRTPTDALEHDAAVAMLAAPPEPDALAAVDLEGAPAAIDVECDVFALRTADAGGAHAFRDCQAVLASAQRQEPASHRIDPFLTR